MPSRQASLAFSLYFSSATHLHSNDHPNRFLCPRHRHNYSEFASLAGFNNCRISAPRYHLTKSRRFSPPCNISDDVSVPSVTLAATDPESIQGTVRPLSNVQNPPKRPAPRHQRSKFDHTPPIAHLKAPSPPSEAMRLKGCACVASGNLGRARSLFQQSIDIDPTNGRAWQDFAKLVGRTSRDSHHKVKVLENALKHNPGNPYLWQSLAFVKLRMSRLEEACEHCQQGIARDPEHVSLYVTWATAEEKLSNLVAAREIYEKADALAIRGAKMYHSWGHMELRQGNKVRAGQLFEKGLNCEPRNHYIWHSLGSIARADHEFGQARDCFLKALESDENNVVVLEELAKLEAQEKNLDLARALFARGAAANKEDVRILHSWSLFEYQMKSYQRAIQLIQDAVRISSRDSILWNHYAKVEAALQNYPKARALYNRACEVNPTDWLSWDNWSALEHRLGNTVQATKLLQESFRIRFNAKGAFTILANKISDAPPA